MGYVNSNDYYIRLTQDNLFEGKVFSYPKLNGLFTAFIDTN